jgi:hypothetical protein
MSAAERQRRRRARLRDNMPVTKRVSPAALARAHARIAQLEHELAAAKKRRSAAKKKKPDDDDPINALIRRVTEFVIEDFAPKFERWLEKTKPNLDTDALHHLDHALEMCAMRLQELAQSMR